MSYQEYKARMRQFRLAEIERIARAREAAEQLERDRQIEADRLASEANPPVPLEPNECYVWFESPNADKECSKGTVGCCRKHDGSDPTYAERLAAWNAQAKAGQRHTKFTGD